MKKFILIILILFPGMLNANGYIVLQSTTSTQNSGFYEYILPIYYKFSGIKVRVIAVGTGQALKNSRNCDGDVLIAHSKIDEIEFVEKGFGLYRKDLMYNDFVVVGPNHNPAKINNSDSLSNALRKISLLNATFISRADNSGTHKAELRLWNKAKVDIDKLKSSKNYKEVGLGMGAALNVAVQLDAYTLSDRSTWISFNNKLNHKIIFQNNENLFNQYGIVSINPKHCKNVKMDMAENFINWMVSREGQKSINSFKINEQQIFFSNFN